MRSSPVIVWFRNDLRIADNPALTAAAATGAPVVALYVLDDAAPDLWRRGAASRWWLHHSLQSLSETLQQLGIQLVLRQGRAEFLIEDLAVKIGATKIYWNRLYEPWAMERDSLIKTQLRNQNIEAQSFNASLLFEPSHLRNKQGEVFKVFTPFWRACLAAAAPQSPLAAPKKLNSFSGVESDVLSQWTLTPRRPDWAKAFSASWEVGEAAALNKLKLFLSKKIISYKIDRDFMAKEGVSRLSPHLHFGEISPRQIWFLTQKKIPNSSEAFLREIGWREFCYHLLVANPQMPCQPLDRKFGRFAWREDVVGLEAWQRGQTGYPIIDAAMRELWVTGYMHNRARMVAASFLVKHLLVPWQEGARWFWDTLVDADLANNSGGWQWVSGCGADAAPYFRVFNPVIQGEKFDPEGAYVRKYVPEVSKLPKRFIHRPWEAPSEVLQAADVVLGKTYPHPIVDHVFARQRALKAYENLRLENANA